MNNASNQHHLKARARFRMRILVATSSSALLCLLLVSQFPTVRILWRIAFLTFVPACLLCAISAIAYLAASSKIESPRLFQKTLVDLFAVVVLAVATIATLMGMLGWYLLANGFRTS